MGYGFAGEMRALPRSITATPRSAAMQRKAFSSPSRQISVRIVSPGKTGATNRTAKAFSRPGS